MLHLDIPTPIEVIQEVQEIPEDSSGIVDIDLLSEFLVTGLPFVIRNAFSNHDSLPRSEQYRSLKINKGSKAHIRHRAFLEAAVLKAGLSHVAIEENLARSFSVHTGEHFDGLDGQFWQIHTTKRNVPNVPFCRAVFRRYPADPERHFELLKVFKKLRKNGYSAGPETTVSDRPEIGISMPTITDHTLGVPFTLQAVAKHFDTLVLPNGYKASNEDDLPQELWTHEFTSETSGNSSGGLREVALSRLDANI